MAIDSHVTQLSAQAICTGAESHVTQLSAQAICTGAESHVTQLSAQAICTGVQSRITQLSLSVLCQVGTVPEPTSARIYAVTLYDATAPNGEDVTGYLEPNFASSRAVGEQALMAYEAADMTFSFKDLGDPVKAPRYWSQRIQRSGHFTLPNGKGMLKPCLKVEDITDYTQDSGNPKLLLFFGQVESSSPIWKDVARSGVTAVSQLSYGERLDAADIEPGVVINLCGNTSGTGSGYVWTSGSTRWAAGAGDYISEGIMPGDLLYVGGVAYTIAQVNGPHTLTLYTAAPAGPASSYVWRTSWVPNPLNAYPVPVCVPSAVLARRWIRLLGNQSPNTDNGDVPDVVIDDFKLGTGAQTDSDWNLAGQDWADAGKPPNEANGLSEMVPSVSGDRLGFVCANGKLFRVDAATPGYGSASGRNVTNLTQITTVPGGLPSGHPYYNQPVLNGYRLFAYDWLDGSGTHVPCLCIVQTQFKSMYNSTDNDWLSPWTTGAQLLGDFASRFIKVTKANRMTVGIGLPMANIAYSIIAQQIGNMTKHITVRNTGNYRRIISAITIMSIGSGTNDPVTGVGGTGPDGLNVSIYAPGTPLGDTAFSYVLGDSVCVDYPGTGKLTPGESTRIFLAVHTETSSVPTIVITSRHVDSGGGFVAEAYPVTFHDANYFGEPAGGMAFRRGIHGPFLFVGWQAGYSVLRWGSSDPVLYQTTLDRSPERFVGSLPLDTGVAFLPGNAVALRDSGTGTEKQIYVWARGNSGTPLVDEIPYAGTLPDGFKVCVTGEQAFMGPTSQAGVPCIFKALNVKNQEYQYAGWLYLDGTDIKLDTGLCINPVPGSGQSDFRPPMLFLDSGGGYYRFVVPCSRLDGDRLAATIWYSSVWAVPMIAWDPVAHPLTVRDALVGLGKAHGCLLHLMGTDKPTTAADVKVQTRHTWTPPDIGELKGTLSPYPQVQGTEFYLGATANCYGEEINIGQTRINVSRFVYQMDTMFATPNWIRAVGNWLVGQYPELSDNYPDGRRLFSMKVHTINGGIPHQGHVYGRGSIAAWQDTLGQTMYGLLLGLTPKGPNANLSEAWLIEDAGMTVVGGAAPDPVIVALPAEGEES